MVLSELDLSRAVESAAGVHEDDLRYLVSCVRQGQCCSVVAPSNMGKSLLLKSLSQDEVRCECAPSADRTPVVVFVDCLEAGDSEHALYELMLRRIVDELEDSAVPAAIMGTVRAMHHEVLRTTTDISVRSLFASSIRELDRWAGMRLVVILDEFDDVFSALPPWPFRQLRALRDALGDRLCYVTGTSRRLERLRSDADTYEFRELFHLYTVVLRPLPDIDAQRFIAYLAAKLGAVPGEKHEELAIRLSGGHLGLLERIYSIVKDIGPESPISVEAAVVALSAQEPIQKECERLWEELEGEEQEGLLALAGGGEVALDDIKRGALETKGLVVVGDGGRASVFSPIFDAFLRGELAQRRGSKAQGVRCEPETGRIWSDDREVTLQLSEPQRKLVRLLHYRRGAVCSYDEIAEEVWGVGEGVTPGAIYELVKRLRQKVEPDWRDPCYVVTVPGEGYRLQIPE
jgi:hypothetical protein